MKKIVQTCDWHASSYIAQVDMHDDDKKMERSVILSNGIVNKNLRFMSNIYFQLYLILFILIQNINCTDIIVDWSPESIL